MEGISTPLRSKLMMDPRRASMMAEASGSPLRTTPLRKSVTKPSNPESLVLNNVSDDTERHARRSMVAINKRLSNLPSPSPILDLKHLMDESEMKDHIQVCSKLFIENKINTKNAWELKIFDIMSQLAESNQPNVLQLAGTTLDIGARVYAVRVDDVHARCLKLASSMNTVSNQNRQSEDDDNDGGNDADQSKTAAARRKKRNKNKKFLGQVPHDENPMLERQRKLNAPLNLLEPVCFSTKEDIDVSATDNLFTVKFRNHPATHDLEFMSKEVHWVNNNDPDVITREIDEINTTCPKLRRVKLGGAFSDFDICIWNPDEEAQWASNSFADVVLDENGCPIVELDGSIHDIFEDNHDNNLGDDEFSEENIQEQFQFKVDGKMSNIVDAIPGEHLSAHEYGFNTLLTSATGKVMEKMWAGPSHWKLKCIKRGPARYSGSVVQKQAAPRRRVKVIEKLDFSAPEEPFEFVRKPHVNHNKKLPTPANLRKITLPDTFLEDDADSRVLLMKPSICVFNTQDHQRPPVLDDCDVSVYNYENPNDSQYCSEITDDQRNDDVFGEDQVDEENVAAAHINFLPEHLVDAPEMVQTSSVPYALHAKKMDMKKLKSALLKTMNSEKTESNGITRFSHILENLPQNLNSDMKKELSGPLAFLAMLHLANENNFMLEQEFGSNKDFSVRKIAD